LLSFGLLAALCGHLHGMTQSCRQLTSTIDVDGGAASCGRHGSWRSALSLLFVVLRCWAAFSLIVLGGQIQEWLGSGVSASATALLRSSASFGLDAHPGRAATGRSPSSSTLHRTSSKKFNSSRAGSVVGVRRSSSRIAGFLPGTFTPKASVTYDATYGQRRCGS